MPSAPPTLTEQGSEATLADARRRAEDDPALARELFGLDRELIGHLKKQATPRDAPPRLTDANLVDF